MCMQPGCLGKKSKSTNRPSTVKPYQRQVFSGASAFGTPKVKISLGSKGR